MAVNLESRTDQLRALRDLPLRVREAVSGLEGARLEARYRAGGWTLRQLVHHLADAHVNGFCRLRLVLSEEHPTLRPYDQDAWAELGDAREGPVEESLALLEALHGRMVRLLEGLPEAAFERTAFHPEVGEVTLAGLVRTYAEHGDHHLAQILQARG